MAVDVIMPQMGESIFEGTITKWLKKAGDKIERDEPLFEISTDKVDAEIPSPSAGVLKEIKVGEGQTVPIQTVVAVIEAGADGAATAAPAAAPAKPASAAPAPPPAAAKSAAPSPLQRQPRRSSKPAASSGEKVRSSPLVRKIARENNIDVSQVPGTGAGGRVSKSDILSACKVVAHQPRQLLQLPRARRQLLRPRVPREFLQPQAAPALPPFSKTPSRAKKCISAITKSSPCPSCASASPSTWSSRSAFLRTFIPWTKRT